MSEITNFGKWLYYACSLLKGQFRGCCDFRDIARLVGMIFAPIFKHFRHLKGTLLYPFTLFFMKGTQK